MMDTMLGSGVTWGWHIHLIFGGAIFLGAIFLIILAAKFMSKKELLNWAVWAIILGIIGTLLTGGWGFSGWEQIIKLHNGGGIMDSNMLEQMQEHMGS